MSRCLFRPKAASQPLRRSCRIAGSRFESRPQLPMTSSDHPRILVIEDESQIRKFLRISLESNGFVVTETDNRRKGDRSRHHGTSRHCDPGPGLCPTRMD